MGSSSLSFSGAIQGRLPFSHAGELSPTRCRLFCRAEAKCGLGAEWGQAREDPLGCHPG